MTASFRRKAAIRHALARLSFTALILGLGAEAAQAGTCSIDLQGSATGMRVIHSFEPCPKSAFATDNAGHAGAASDIGASAAEAFAFAEGGSHAVGSSGTFFGANTCEITGPGTSVLTRANFEMEWHVNVLSGLAKNVARNQPGVVSQTLTVDLGLGFAGTRSELAVQVKETGINRPSDGLSCVFTGVFAGTGCAASISVGRQHFQSPEFSAPVGLTSLQVMAFPQSFAGLSSSMDDPSSASGRASVSLPTDGSPVLDLPAGFDFNCTDGTVVNNVFQGSAVSAPGPAVPALSPIGTGLLGIGLLGILLAATGSVRVAARRS